MGQHPAPAVTAQVRILGNQYLVVLDGHSHIVSKDRRCHTCNDECKAVNEVARYLKAGDQRGPETCMHWRRWADARRAALESRPLLGVCAELAHAEAKFAEPIGDDLHVPGIDATIRSTIT